MNRYNYLVFFLISILFFSCTTDPKMLKEIERIKEIGNSDPVDAIEKLSSLQVRQDSGYLKSKIDLLSIRLRDKADFVPTSADSIKSLIAYFKNHGTVQDKQEVFYYAGSVYRDLHDYPSAIDNFLKAQTIAEQHPQICDSIMLRNTYSNLSYAYSYVQDYHSFLIYSKKECNLESKLNGMSDIGLTHLAHAYILTDSIQQAIPVLDTVFYRQKNAIDKDVDILSTLLYNYAYLKIKDRAAECVKIIEEKCRDYREYLDSRALLSLGWYYYESDKIDSAKMCYQIVIDNDEDWDAKYNASKVLFHLCLDDSKKDEALNYALLFCQICDSINLGKRQEMSATITNMYKYHRDKNEEQRIIVENQDYKNLIFKIISLGITFLLSVLGYILFMKNLHLKKTVELSGIIHRIKQDNDLLRMDVLVKNKELEESKQTVEITKKEIQDNKVLLEKLNNELETISNELKIKERILIERLAQNQTFIKLLHQTKLEKSSEEVITTLRQSSLGRKTMTHEDWRQFYKAVDELYPSFKDTLIQKLEKITEEQMQVCYLMRTGFTKPQIQNLTGLARVTVWRWDKKYDWITELLSKDI